MDLHVLSSLEFENNIFQLLVFPFLSTCVCVSVISITQDQEHIVAEILNLVSYICNMRRSYLKIYMNIGQIASVMGTQNNSIALLPMEGISCQCIFIHLENCKYNLHTFLPCLKNATNTIWLEHHAQLVYRATQKIYIHS